MGTTQDPGPSRGPGPGRGPAWPGPRARPGVRRPGPRPGGHRHGVAEPHAQMGASAWASASARPEAQAVTKPLRAPLLSAVAACQRCLPCQRPTKCYQDSPSAAESVRDVHHATPTHECPTRDRPLRALNSIARGGRGVLCGCEGGWVTPCGTEGLDLRRGHAGDVLPLGAHHGLAARLQRLQQHRDGCAGPQERFC